MILPHCTFPECQCSGGCEMDDSYLGDARWYHWLGFFSASMMLFAGVALLVRFCT